MAKRPTDAQIAAARAILKADEDAKFDAVREDAQFKLAKKDADDWESVLFLYGPHDHRRLDVKYDRDVAFWDDCILETKPPKIKLWVRRDKAHEVLTYLRE